MECKEATLSLIRTMFADPAQQEQGELAEHLRACPDCRRRGARYQRMRDEVAGMDRAAFPPEAQEMLMEGLRGSAAAVPAAAPKPPADPRPESSTLHRVLFFTCAMLALGLVMVGLLTAFRGEMKPIPVAAQASYWTGKVYAQTLGGGNRRELSRGDAILPGTALLTDPEAVLALTTDTARWWMDGSSALALGEGGTAELAQGRVCAQCTAPEQQPVRLMTTAGMVTCSTGQFVARVSPTRLTIACVSGSVSVGPADAPTQLTAGQQAMLADEVLLGPVRNVRVAELTDWLQRFPPGTGEGMTPRRLASVPLPPDQPALPDGVSIEELNVGLTARGPLVLLELSGRLRNAAVERREVMLSADGLVLPRPLAATGPVRVDLPGGGAGEFQLSAVCALTARAGHYVLGLNPLAWTKAAVGHLDLRVDASAEGGLRAVALPAQDLSARRQDKVTWSWTAAEYAPEEPIVLDMELAKSGPVDALRLSTPEGDWALCAWRPDADDYAWIRKGRSVLLAFDATGDFGPGGAVYAQEVMEVLVAAIPPAVPTALVAYDGNLALDRNPWSPNLPPRVESLLGTIWCLDPAGRGGQGAGFLARAVELAGGAKGQKLLIYVTGAGEPADAATLDALKLSDDVQIVVVQMGARRPAAAYSGLCARSGGAAVALDPDEAPRLAGFDLLVALQSAAVRAASAEANGALGVVVLAGPGGFANAPVVALVPLPASGGVAGMMRADVGGKALEQRFGPLAAGDAVCEGAQAQELVRLMLAGAAGRPPIQK